MRINLKINGIDKLVDDLKKLGKEAEEAAVKNLDKSSLQIAFKANRNAPDFVKPMIGRDKENKGLNIRVFVKHEGDPMPAYFEFGTGTSAATRLAGYPDEIKKLAYTFYVNGKGTMRGKPYFFPAYFEEAPKLIENLKRDLERLKL